MNEIDENYECEIYGINNQTENHQHIPLAGMDLESIQVPGINIPGFMSALELMIKICALDWNFVLEFCPRGS